MDYRRPPDAFLRVSRFALTVALAAASLSAHAQPTDAGAPNACQGILASPQRMRAALAEVRSYSTTYLLVTREGPDAATSLDSAALQHLEMGVHAGTAAEALVAAARVPRVRPYSVPGADAGAMLSDVLSAKIGAAVLWAPLAGLSALERDPENRLGFRTVGGPQPPPSMSDPSEGAETKCAEEIKSLLEAYGVVPAEHRSRSPWGPCSTRGAADRSLAAEAGREIFAARCARCHGEQVVAARDALAPWTSSGPCVVSPIRRSSTSCSTAAAKGAPGLSRHPRGAGDSEGLPVRPRTQPRDLDATRPAASP